MQIVISKTFATRRELDTYVASLGESTNVSLTLSADESQALALDPSVTVYGSSVSVLDSSTEAASPAVARGVISLGGRRKGAGKKKK